MQDTETHPIAERAALIADWLRLEQADGVGCRSAHALLSAFGSPAAIFRAAPAALAAHVSPGQARALCAPVSPALTALVEATLAWLAQPGHHLLTFHDPLYPASLAEIPDPPLLLYAAGRIEMLARPLVAVVGSRNASVQGKLDAESFAAALSGAGLCVVSGLALGIDTAAHEGALRGPGATIAVVGTGLDRVYPARNRQLAHRIAEHGCLLSEYALGTPPLAANFPRRNRVISGLAAGVLVIEAAAQSGSLITAQMAAEQGREVFALPGSIHSALAKGCHRLIRDGAQLVETVDEVLLAMRVSPLAAIAQEKEAGPDLMAEEDADLLAALGHEPVALDDLLARLGADAGELGGRLLGLELAGLVAQLPGGRVQRIWH
ncbi:DNA-processing protein DprA [Massilia sp. CFBP9026]|uniref:DNA-processing protein DprA n=1 Tax=Massilia sp. CFBP9026 TaxID=3096536 RepID=UPI002A6AEA51|nr:DNA-processing protein DprA [Massilia sp. CFBP9026]MDY0965541.1 DNA-processing protein DprA [Massilia sp. CFBP9026]